MSNINLEEVKAATNEWLIKRYKQAATESPADRETMQILTDEATRRGLNIQYSLYASDSTAG